MEKNASDCQRVPVSYHPLMHDSENAVSASSVRLGVENSSNEATNDGREGVDDDDDDPLSNFDDPLGGTVLGGGDLIHLVLWVGTSQRNTIIILARRKTMVGVLGQEKRT